MLDLESAIQYSLHQEVSLRSHIEGEELQALTNYVGVLSKVSVSCSVYCTWALHHGCTQSGRKLDMNLEFKWRQIQIRE